MHLYFDFLDILEFIFKKNNFFSTIDFEDIKQMRILLDSKKIFSQQFSKKRNSVKLNIKKIKKIFKNNQVKIFLPNKTLIEDKNNILRYQKIRFAEQKFSFLNFVDDMYENRQKTQNYLKTINKVQEQNKLRQYFLVQYFQRTILNFCSKNGIQINRSQQIVDIQIKNYIEQTDEDQVIFGSLGILLITQKKVQIAQNISKNKIKTFDIKKFQDYLNLKNPENLKQYLIWTLIIYTSQIYNCEGLYYQAVIQNTHNVLQSYEDILITQSQIVLNIIKNIDSNFYNNITYNSIIKFNVFFKFDINQFTKTYKQYLQILQLDDSKYNQKDLDIQNFNDNNQNFVVNLIPFNLIDMQNYKQSLIVNSLRIYQQSNELNFLEYNFGKIFARKIFKLMAFYAFNQIPKKIIYKQLHGQVFLKIEKKQKLNYDLVPKNVFDKTKLSNSLISLSANYHVKNDAVVSFDDILHASFIFFFHQVEVTNLYQGQKYNQIQFLNDFIKFGQIEHGILILQFYQKGFFNHKSFLQNNFSFQQQPENLEKQHNLLTEHQYKRYKKVNFQHPRIDFLQKLQELFKQSRQMAHQFFWTDLLQCKCSNKKYFYHETYRNILYFVVTKYLNLTNLEMNQFLNIWDNLQCFIIENTVSLHFLTIFSFFVKTSLNETTTFFSKEMKIQDCFEFIKQNYHSIIFVNIVNLAKQFNISNEQILNNYHKIPFNDVYCYSTAINLKYAIILIWTCKNLHMQNQNLMDCFKNQIKNLIAEISCKKNFLKEMENIVNNFVDAALKNHTCFDRAFLKQLLQAKKFM